MKEEFAVVLKVESYIAEPYWPELQELIDIYKMSGYNRAKTESSRENALQRWLEKNGLEMAFVEDLKKRSSYSWYRFDAQHHNNEAEIIIPRHQISGCLVHASASAPPAGSKFKPEQLRSLVMLSDFHTGKVAPDGIFARFVMPKDAKTNKPLSHMRSLRKNEFIKHFTATGSIQYDPNDVSPQSINGLITYAGKYIGVGAARKMGYGRFVPAFPDNESTSADGE